MRDQERNAGGYTPDPEAETAMVIDAFFAGLGERFPGDGLLGRLASRHAQLVADQQHRIVDEPSRHNLAMTLAVLAAYQELASDGEEESLIEALRAAFVEPLEPFVRTATRSVLDQAPDPFRAMVDLTKDREEHAFGAGFVFTHPDNDHDRYTAQVERCFYHGALAANGAAHLTQIFCAFDSNWIDAIDPVRDGFEFERPTTISTGGRSCPFQFRRTTDAGDR